MNKFTYLLEDAQIVKESEKALRISVMIGDERRTEVWFPKSQVEFKGEEIWVSAWILEQKDREVCGLNEAGIAAGCYPDGKLNPVNN